MEQQNNPSQNVRKFHLLPGSDALSLALKSQARQLGDKKGFKDPYGTQRAGWKALRWRGTRT